MVSLPCDPTLPLQVQMTTMLWVGLGFFGMLAFIILAVAFAMFRDWIKHGIG